MKRKLKSHLNLDLAHPYQWHWEAAMHQNPSFHEAQCAYKETCAFWESAQPGAGVCRKRHLVTVGLPQVNHGTGAVRAMSPPVFFCQSRGRSSASRWHREKPWSDTLKSPASCLLSAGAYCWDKSALLFAFIFSRRFTKWPLLTSSSSVLSSAERSWKW
jgi:hypothetical protein